MTDSNPWIADHIAAETDFQDGDRALAERLVAIEYADAPPPIPCPHQCGSTTYYKATIGAMKCPDCGGLATTQGDAIKRDRPSSVELIEQARQERP